MTDAQASLTEAVQPSDAGEDEDRDTAPGVNGEETGESGGERDRVPRPEELDPDRADADETGETRETGERRTATHGPDADPRYGPCDTCGSWSSRCYKCSECGTPW